MLGHMSSFPPGPPHYGPQHYAPLPTGPHGHQPPTQYPPAPQGQYPSGIDIEFKGAQTVGIIILFAFGGLAVAGGIGAVASGDTGGIVVGIIIALIGLGVLAAAFVGLSKAKTSNGLVVDGRGIHLRHGAELKTFPWQEIAATAISYKIAPRVKITDVKMKQSTALEIYPVDPNYAQRNADFARQLRRGEPLRPGLPAERFLIILPPFNNISGRVEQALTTVNPSTFVGRYQRAWSPGLGS